MSETERREALATLSRSLFERGLSSGSTGNISVRIDDGWLMTPTGSSLGALDPAKLSKLDENGRHVAGDPPTKESVIHTAVFAQRPAAGAVVHLHSPYAVAVSCLADVDADDVMPPLTPYYVMRVGVLPLVPYFPPGDPDLAAAVAAAATNHHAMLLANHGPVVAGVSLEDAIYASEELEETAKLFIMLHGRPIRPLTEAQVATLHERFPAKA